MKNLGIFICSLLISAFSVSALFAADTLPPGDSAKARSRSAAVSSKQLKLFVFKELATDTVINIVLNSSEIPRFYRSTPARSCFKTSALDAKWSCLDALYWVRVLSRECGIRTLAANGCLVLSMAVGLSFRPKTKSTKKPEGLLFRLSFYP